MIKSFFIAIFMMCFLFSINGQAKLLTTKEVKAIKAEASQKKKGSKVVQKKKVTSKSVALKQKVQKQKRIGAATKKAPVRKVVRLDFEQPEPKQRKVVRLDFDQPTAVKPKVKPRKELKSIAKAEKSKKRKLRATQCADGHVVGHQAFCTTTAKAQLKKAKGRSLASKTVENKKLR